MGLGRRADIHGTREEGRHTWDWGGGGGVEHMD